MKTRPYMREQLGTGQSNRLVATRNKALYTAWEVLVLL